MENNIFILALKFMGKSINCAEYVTLKTFLKENENEQFSMKYAKIAPLICRNIEAYSGRDDCYQYIVSVIDACAECIKNGQYDDVFARLIRMLSIIKYRLFSDF